jgi:uncharacterized membrane protein YbhN (UPF0104 family)
VAVTEAHVTVDSWFKALQCVFLHYFNLAADVLICGVCFSSVQKKWLEMEKKINRRCEKNE